LTQFSVAKFTAFIIAVVDKYLEPVQAINDIILVFGFTQIDHFQLFISAAIIHATHVQWDESTSGIGSLSLFLKSYQ
jgi:hypothetical protein